MLRAPDQPTPLDPPVACLSARALIGFEYLTRVFAFPASSEPVVISRGGNIDT
jgi:hypothetical protein